MGFYMGSIYIELLIGFQGLGLVGSRVRLGFGGLRFLNRGFIPVRKWVLGLKLWGCWILKFG